MAKEKSRLDKTSDHCRISFGSFLRNNSVQSFVDQEKMGILLRINSKDIKIEFYL